MDTIPPDATDHVVQLWQLVLTSIAGPAAAVIVQFFDGRHKNKIIDAQRKDYAEITKQLATTNATLVTAAMEPTHKGP